MSKSQMEIGSIIKQPSAYIPVAISLTAFAIVIFKVLGDLVTHGAIIREADEGIAAHVWQLLMVGQLPVLGFFAIKWLPQAPRPALSILALQIGAALASFAAVFFLRL
jgi:hypothetical protein